MCCGTNKHEAHVGPRVPSLGLSAAGLAQSKQLTHALGSVAAIRELVGGGRKLRSCRAVFHNVNLPRVALQKRAISPCLANLGADRRVERLLQASAFGAS